MQTPTEAAEPEPASVPLPSRTYAGLGIWALALIIVSLIGSLIFIRSFSRDLNHDEHQFLAPASLLARHDLIPYRDYPLFHLPNLVFAYSCMEQLVEDPILGAKILSSLASAGTVFLLFWIALSRSGNALRPWERLWVATGTSLILILDPLFLFTAGKTWNHEVPAFLQALAVVFHVESLRARPLLLGTLSGLVTGIAVGCRLTYLPPCAAFLLHLALWGGDTWKERLRGVSAWSIGCVVGLIPVFYFLIATREAFLFDNLTFPRLLLLESDNVALTKKIQLFLKEVMEQSWPLAVLYIGLGIVPMYQAFKNRRPEGGAVFSLLLGISVLAGCFAPARYQYQHFFAVVVVGAVGIVYRCKEGILERWERAIIMGGIAVLAMVSIIGVRINAETNPKPHGWRPYAQARGMRDAENWFSTRYRRQYEVMTRYIAAGERVLTLAPAAVLAANREIYPEFATGPFAYRGASLVEPELRKHLHFVAPEDLPKFLEARPPDGILTGFEEELETELTAYAKEHHYYPIQLSKRKRTLWVPLSKVGMWAAPPRMP